MLFWGLACLVVGAYLGAPIVAGIFEIGDRLGPRIYRVSLHENLYLLGWELSVHDEQTPVVPIGARSDLRPWFYGGKAGYDDPEYQEKALRELRERSKREREMEKSAIRAEPLHR